MLGAVGLILPGLLKIKPALTWIAATALVIIMIGATALTIAGDGVAAAVVPFVTAVLCAFVAYGRCRIAPHARAK